MKKYYGYYTPFQTLGFIAGVAVAGALIAAFYRYGLYVAILFCAGLICFVIYSDFRLFLISDEAVGVRTLKSDSGYIKPENIILLETSAQGGRTLLAIYGEGKSIVAPFREKTFRSLLGLLGLSEAAQSMCSNSEFAAEISGYELKVERVVLDGLFSKKNFYKRRVAVLKLPEIKREETEDTDNVTEADIS